MKKFDVSTVTHNVIFEDGEIAHEFDVLYDYCNKHHFWINIKVNKEGLFSNIMYSDLSDQQGPKHYKYKTSIETDDDLDTFDFQFLQESLNKVLSRSFYLSYIIIHRDTALTNDDIEELNLYEVTYLKLDTPHRKLVDAMNRHITSIMTSDMRAKDFLEI